jgi:hypothetical protein
LSLPLILRNAVPAIFETLSGDDGRTAILAKPDIGMTDSSDDELQIPFVQLPSGRDLFLLPSAGLRIRGVSFPVLHG